MEDLGIGERLFDRRRLPDLGFSLPDDPAGDPLIRLDTVRRLALHNDQLLPYTLDKDRYPDSGRWNYALGLIIAEPFNTPVRTKYLVRTGASTHEPPGPFGV